MMADQPRAMRIRGRAAWAFDGGQVANFLAFNRATSRFDPSIFFANRDAVDESKLVALIKSNSRYCNCQLRFL